MCDSVISRGVKVDYFSGTKSNTRTLSTTGPTISPKALWAGWGRYFSRPAAFAKVTEKQWV